MTPAARLLYTGLTSEQFRALYEMGLSTDFFAAYDTAVQVVIAPMFMATPVVVFWKRSEDPIALFGSFTLLLFDGATFTSELLFKLRLEAASLPISELPRWSRLTELSDSNRNSNLSERLGTSRNTEQVSMASLSGF